MSDHACEPVATVHIVSPKNPHAPTLEELSDRTGIPIAQLEAVRLSSWSCRGDCDHRQPVTWAEWAGRVIVHTCRRNP